MNRGFPSVNSGICEIRDPSLFITFERNFAVNCGTKEHILLSHFLAGCESDRPVYFFTVGDRFPSCLVRLPARHRLVAGALAQTASFLRNHRHHSVARSQVFWFALPGNLPTEVFLLVGHSCNFPIPYCPSVFYE